jgi:DNA-binding NtrC family response regulator
MFKRENVMKESLRVLFVDDDPSWLNALRRSLRRTCPDWQVCFASDGFKALELLESESFDVIVSDLNMPGLRGDSLLNQISEKHPETIRFILSGSSSSECKSTGQSLAMEFISKDTDPQDLMYRIARGVSLRRFMRSRVVDRLADVILRMGDLPNLTMKLINPSASDKATAPCIELSCPDLGLEFRTLLSKQEILV